MSSDTFESIWQEVSGHSPTVDPLLVQSWVRDTWREIAEARTWSWLQKRSVIALPAPYSTGTVDVTPGSSTLTFTGATLTDTMIGRQFRSGSYSSVYDITAIDASANTAEIFPPWRDTESADTGRSYKIFSAYVSPPDSDFFAWISVTDPKNRKRLRLHVNQEEIDYFDPARNMTAIGPAALSGIDWSDNYSGKVYSALQVRGSGPAPTPSGNYSGQTDSIYIIKVTTGGGRGVGEFSYQKDSGTVTTGQSIAAVVNIADNIVLSWPDDTFILNDTFVFRVTAIPQYGAPRYEIYPHPTAAIYLPATYTVRVRDIDEANFVLPYTMRGDIIKLGALAKMSRYPGTDNKPNPYAQIARAQSFEDRFMEEVGYLMTQDDYIMETNVSNLPWEDALLPWMTTSGTGLRPTQTHDPRDLLL